MKLKSKFVKLDDDKNETNKDDNNIKKIGQLEEQLQKIINEVDINQDGEISFEEFAIMMKNILIKNENINN